MKHVYCSSCDFADDKKNTENYSDSNAKSSQVPIDSRKPCGGVYLLQMLLYCIPCSSLLFMFADSK